MDWLFSRPKREVLAFLGTGLAAVVAAIWTVFLFLQPVPATTQVKMTYCVGSVPKRCPQGTTFVSCRSKKSLETIIAEQCASIDYAMKRTSKHYAGACGYATYEVTCTASSR
jgi:hypothetical protein